MEVKRSITRTVLLRIVLLYNHSIKHEDGSFALCLYGPCFTCLYSYPQKSCSYIYINSYIEEWNLLWTKNIWLFRINILWKYLIEDQLFLFNLVKFPIKSRKQFHRPTSLSCILYRERQLHLIKNRAAIFLLSLCPRFSLTINWSKEDWWLIEIYMK